MLHPVTYIKRTAVWIAVLLLYCGCEKIGGLENPSPDPVAVFNELWKVMDERYSLFDIKNVDWDSVYDSFSEKVNNKTSEHELFLILRDMLETLKDGHVSLMTKTDTATYSNFYEAYPANFNYGVVVNNYLKNDFNTTGPVIYKVEDQVGYLYYASFAQPISDAELDEVFTAFTGTKGLIIDVRNNTGGNNDNVLKLFRRFSTGRQLVKYEQRKNGPGHTDFGEPEAFYVESAIAAFTKPVIVLTNRTCFSACNDFVLFMKTLSQVKQIGDQTGGGGALPHNYILANGWRIQYSATKTLDRSKQPVENGLLPDINVNISPMDESNGKDPILDKAIQLLQ